MGERRVLNIGQIGDLINASDRWVRRPITRRDLSFSAADPDIVRYALIAKDEAINPGELLETGHRIALQISLEGESRILYMTPADGVKEATLFRALTGTEDEQITELLMKSRTVPLAELPKNLNIGDIVSLLRPVQIARRFVLTQAILGPRTVMQPVNAPVRNIAIFAQGSEQPMVSSSNAQSFAHIFR